MNPLDNEVDEPTLMVRIKMTGSAFEDLPGHEAARLLEKVAARLRTDGLCPDTPMPLLDINGHSCGTATLLHPRAVAHKVLRFLRGQSRPVSATQMAEYLGIEYDPLLAALRIHERHGNAMSDDHRDDTYWSRT